MKIYKLIIFFMIMGSFSCNKSEEGEKDTHAGHEMNHERKNIENEEVLYWCPMDTQIVRNEPGTCPVCGMDLERKPEAHSPNHISINSSRDWTYTPTNASVLSNVKFVKPVYKSVPLKIKASGYISYDERRINTISTKIGGRIEKLYVKYNFQPIKKGQALFEIFSHDLQTAQQEYFYLKRNDPEAIGLLSAAKKKLLLLGMTEAQVNRIATEDHVHATTTVYSPYSGFVLEENETKKVFSSGESMDNNSGMNMPVMNEESQEISLREGAYVDRGQAVIKVANTDVVWAVFEVYSSQLKYVKVNQPIHILLESTGEMMMGKINFIEPSYKEESGTVKLRVYLDNKKQHLKIGNLLSGEIEAGNQKGLWIPSSAVYDLGTDKIVFVKRGGVFETRKIVAAYFSDKQVEVVSGLAEDDEIAENAAYMVDSESFIKVSK